MRELDQQQMALECLRLAISGVRASTTTEIVASASQFLAFVTGESRDEAESTLLRVERAISPSQERVAS